MEDGIWLVPLRSASYIHPLPVLISKHLIRTRRGSGSWIGKEDGGEYRADPI